MWAVGSCMAVMRRYPVAVVGTVWKCWRRRNAAAFGDDYRGVVPGRAGGDFNPLVVGPDLSDRILAH